MSTISNETLFTADSLFSNINSIEKNEKNIIERYLSPYDSTLLKLSLSDVEIDSNANNVDEKGKPIAKIKISTIQEKVFSTLGIQSTTNNTKKKCLTELKVQYPTTTTPCPRLSQVRKIISSQQLNKLFLLLKI